MEIYNLSLISPLIKFIELKKAVEMDSLFYIKL